MRKIVIASDSFKGSLTSSEVADSVELGIRKVFPECMVEKICIADGGEGSVDALVRTMDGQYVQTEVHDPLMRHISARYGLIAKGSAAVIEMAAASGLTLLAPQERNPLLTTSFGTGELILHALNSGCRRFFICIGGSATNDAGTGMLQALGFRFLDARGRELGLGGEILNKIETIDSSQVFPEVFESEFVVACDVSNPLSGPSGAAYVFAPQKGADQEAVRRLDAGLKHFSDVIAGTSGLDVDSVPGAGAAGGLGAAFVAFLNGKLVAGIRMILDAVDFDSRIADCDLIITGEGSLDSQTAMGKVPSGVLEAARKRGVPVIAVGGCVEQSEKLMEMGFSAVFPIVQGPVSLEKAMERDVAAANIRLTVSQIMNLINCWDKS